MVVDDGYDRIAAQAESYRLARIGPERTAEGTLDEVRAARLELAKVLIEVGWQPAETIYLALVEDALRLNESAGQGVYPTFP